MGAQGEAKPKAFRVILDPQLLARAKAKAQSEGRSLAWLIRRCLDLYAQGKLNL